MIIKETLQLMLKDLRKNPDDYNFCNMDYNKELLARNYSHTGSEEDLKETASRATSIYIAERVANKQLL